jgi:glycosyltransferase involved in cell wall biosynthesis
MTNLTVLLATYNGADLLERTLEGYVALGPQPFDWQIIVVDNASTDATQDVLKAYEDKLPLLSLFESKAGKNVALNQAIPHIKAPNVILSDNDSIPHAGFLESWDQAFKTYPETDVFGGAISPLFDTDMPQWMLEKKPRFMELYALREGIPDGPLGPDYIFGPNMAVRRKLFDDGVQFDEGVGPNSQNASYAMGSETAFCRDAAAKGYRLGYCGKPKVSHIVRENQTTQDFRNKRAYRLGLGTARKHQLEGQIQTGQNGNLLRKIARNIVIGINDLKFQAQTWYGNPLDKTEALWELHFFRGYQDGRRQILNAED